MTKRVYGAGSWGKQPLGSIGSIAVPPPIPAPPGGTGIGWGLEQYGIDPYGAAALTALNLVSALAISTHEVRVTLTAQPQIVVATLSGDALNPATWTVQRLDTAALFTVVRVTEITPTIFVLTTMQRFADVRVIHRVSSTTMLDLAGNTIGQPNQADFAGVLAEDRATELAKLSNRKQTARDIANPPTPSDFRGVLGGTFKVTAGGDYEPVSDGELVRKLIVRRLISSPGDFFHMPDYGVGLPVKEIVPASELIKLKARIDLQVLREPEVSNVSSTLTLSSAGVLNIALKAKLKKTGEEVEVGLQVPQGGGVTF